MHGRGEIEATSLHFSEISMKVFFACVKGAYCRRTAQEGNRYLGLRPKCLPGHASSGRKNVAPIRVIHFSQRRRGVKGFWLARMQEKLFEQRKSLSQWFRGRASVILKWRAMAVLSPCIECFRWFDCFRINESSRSPTPLCAPVMIRPTGNGPRAGRADGALNSLRMVRACPAHSPVRCGVCWC